MDNIWGFQVVLDDRVSGDSRMYRTRIQRLPSDPDLFVPVKGEFPSEETVDCVNRYSELLYFENNGRILIGGFFPFTKNPDPKFLGNGIADRIHLIAIEQLLKDFGAEMPINYRVPSDWLISHLNRLGLEEDRYYPLAEFAQTMRSNIDWGDTELKQRIASAISDIDGLVLVDPNDGLNPWVKSSADYWVMYALKEVAAEYGVSVFLDKRVDVWNDRQMNNMLDLSRDWIDIRRFDDEATARTIQYHLKLPRAGTTLGFGGTLADSCVKRMMENLTEEWAVKPGTHHFNYKEDWIQKKFAKGRLLYELTEQQPDSLCFNEEVTRGVRLRAMPYRIG